MSKVFIIGGGGHIGATVVELLLSNYPDVDVTALQRSEEKAQRFTAKFPKTRSLVGTLDDLEAIETASSQADLVLYFAVDVGQDAAIEAILRGLRSRPEKGYFIHTSGAASTWASEPDGSKPAEKVWDDVKDIKKLTSLPMEKTHRPTDKLVFDAAEDINVAIVSPTYVYGLSPSVEHPLPISLPDIVKTARAVNSGFTVSAGANMWSFIHVYDLARIYMILVVDALGGRKEPKLWGTEAYYFGASYEESFADYMKTLTDALVKKGILESNTIKTITPKEALAAVSDNAYDFWSESIARGFALDMRCIASRARLFGWAPREKHLANSIGEVLEKHLQRTN